MLLSFLCKANQSSYQRRTLRNVVLAGRAKCSLLETGNSFSVPSQVCSLLLCTQHILQVPKMRTRTSTQPQSLQKTNVSAALLPECLKLTQNHSELPEAFKPALQISVTSLTQEDIAVESKHILQRISKPASSSKAGQLQVTTQIFRDMQITDICQSSRKLRQDTQIRRNAESIDGIALSLK